MCTKKNSRKIDLTSFPFGDVSWPGAVVAEVAAAAAAGAGAAVTGGTGAGTGAGAAVTAGGGASDGLGAAAGAAVTWKRSPRQYLQHASM